MRDSSHSQQRRRFLVGICLALVLAVMPACGSDGGTAPVASVAGTWDLTTVNGTRLPFTLQAADPKQELTSRQYVISGSGSFTYSSSVRTTDVDGSVSTANVTDAGTQTLTNNVVTLQHNRDGVVVYAAVEASTMTIITGPFTQVYTRK